MAPVPPPNLSQRQVAAPLLPGYAQPSMQQETSPAPPPSQVPPGQQLPPNALPSLPPQMPPPGGNIPVQSSQIPPPQAISPALQTQLLPSPCPMIPPTGPISLPHSAPAGASAILSGRPLVTQTITAQATGGAYGYGPAPNAIPGGVFGQQDPYSASQKNTTGSDSGTAIAVGVVFGLLVLAILGFLRWRYWQYRKNGGTGTRWEAFFGKSQRREEAKAKAEQKDTWKNWPMLRYVPKYTFGDMAEDNDKKEKEEEDRKKKMAAASKK